MEWLNYLQDTVFFVFYDILLLADYFVCLPSSRQSPLPSFLPTYIY
jgi:hypothetical protein